MTKQGAAVLSLVLPYDGSERLWKTWALAEQAIDFRKDAAEADRCTAAFAALELKTHLAKSDGGLTVVVRQDAPRAGRFIELAIEPGPADDGFTLAPRGEGLLVSGHGRKGLLNGVYEVLRLRGWRWLEPGAYGEAPPVARGFHWPRRPVTVRPSFAYRGLDAYRGSHDSIDYLLWMARNRLNVYFRKAASAKMADKLGMISRQGGHLLALLTDPDRLSAGGRTLWEEHPEWYGLPEDGRRTKAVATRIQLCAAQPSLWRFLADELLGLLATSLAGVDIVDFWGFDTWGKTCACASCRAMGNGADQQLQLFSRLRHSLDKARGDGRLNRKVLLSMAAYEGTASLTPPSKPVPENLRRAGDLVIFYPIKRCYRHALGDPQCEINRPYHAALTGWGRRVRGMSLWSGEYYNVSKYEDLPLLFSRVIPPDMRRYQAAGASGVTYMHALYGNWGMRALTQLQHAHYAWNGRVRDEAVLDDYFRRKYGPYAGAVRAAYALIQTGS
ncbi:MAG: DUF4838 domain-containing protein, partial [Lentisphaerae bacterium]|nr:DUF4838 domain-containing protein [Lentisphaerota bacterium]